MCNFLLKMRLRQAAREIAWLGERRPGQDQAGVRRPSAPIRIRSPPISTISIRPATAGGAIGVAGTPSSLRFRPTAATESGNRRASRLGGNGLTTCSAAKFKSSASAPSESGSGRRPRVSPQSKRVASSPSWAVGSSNYINSAPHTRVPTRATRVASRYSLLPERSLIKDVNGAAVCVGVSKSSRIATVSVHSFIIQWPPSSINARRPTPQEIAAPPL
jgi:hypothetical protein